MALHVRDRVNTGRRNNTKQDRYYRVLKEIVKSVFVSILSTTLINSLTAETVKTSLYFIPSTKFDHH